MKKVNLETYLKLRTKNILNAIVHWKECVESLHFYKWWQRGLERREMEADTHTHIPSKSLMHPYCTRKKNM